jgi:hypothetical protein
LVLNPPRLRGESPLTQWRNATDQDRISFVSDLAALFAGTNDYHLSAPSPAIGTGSALGTPNVDIEGNGRPFGSDYDIDTYEFGSSSPPRTPPLRRSRT